MNDELQQYKKHLENIGKKAMDSLPDIEKACKKLCLKHHPDKGGDIAKFRAVQESLDFIREYREKNPSAEPRTNSASPQAQENYDVLAEIAKDSSILDSEALQTEFNELNERVQHTQDEKFNDFITHLKRAMEEKWGDTALHTFLQDDDELKRKFNNRSSLTLTELIQLNNDLLVYVARKINIIESYYQKNYPNGLAKIEVENWITFSRAYSNINAFYEALHEKYSQGIYSKDNDFQTRINEYDRSTYGTLNFEQIRLLTDGAKIIERSYIENELSSFEEDWNSIFTEEFPSFAESFEHFASFYDFIKQKISDYLKRNIKKSSVNKLSYEELWIHYLRENSARILKQLRLPYHENAEIFAKNQLQCLNSLQTKAELRKFHNALQQNESNLYYLLRATWLSEIPNWQLRSIDDLVKRVKEEVSAEIALLIENVKTEANNKIVNDSEFIQKVTNYLDTINYLSSDIAELDRIYLSVKDEASIIKYIISHYPELTQEQKNNLYNELTPEFREIQLELELLGSGTSANKKDAEIVEQEALLKIIRINSSVLVSEALKEELNRLDRRFENKDKKKGKILNAMKSTLNLRTPTKTLFDNFLSNLKNSLEREWTSRVVSTFLKEDTALCSEVNECAKLTISKQIKLNKKLLAYLAKKINEIESYYQQHDSIKFNKNTVVEDWNTFKTAYSKINKFYESLHTKYSQGLYLQDGNFQQRINAFTRDTHATLNLKQIESLTKGAKEIEKRVLSSLAKDWDLLSTNEIFPTFDSRIEEFPAFYDSTKLKIAHYLMIHIGRIDSSIDVTQLSYEERWKHYLKLKATRLLQQLNGAVSASAVEENVTSPSTFINQQLHLLQELQNNDEIRQFYDTLVSSESKIHWLLSSTWSNKISCWSELSINNLLSVVKDEITREIHLLVSSVTREANKITDDDSFKQNVSTYLNEFVHLPSQVQELDSIYKRLEKEIPTVVYLILNRKKLTNEQKTNFASYTANDFYNIEKSLGSFTQNIFRQKPHTSTPSSSQAPVLPRNSQPSNQPKSSFIPQAATASSETTLIDTLKEKLRKYINDVEDPKRSKNGLLTNFQYNFYYAKESRGINRQINYETAKDLLKLLKADNPNIQDIFSQDSISAIRKDIITNRLSKSEKKKFVDRGINSSSLTKVIDIARQPEQKNSLFSCFKKAFVR